MDSSLNVFGQDGNFVYLNPRLEPGRQERIRSALTPYFAKYPNHFWLMSSGTESAQAGKQKIVALSREAILTAAQGVNETFKLDAKDIYLKSIPHFHIGGLSIYARAYLAGFKVIENPNNKWNAAGFCQILDDHKVTVASLVPTQIFDLVEAQMKAPSSLRFVFVGGGALSSTLFEAARDLGWPLILTYGMTETSAMLAWQKQSQGGAQRFPHILDWRADDERLSFYSKALLSGYVFIDGGGEAEWLDPKREGWYRSDDCGIILQDELYLQGRASEQVKVMGETVSLLEMQSLWEEFLFQAKQPQDSLILALPDERLGHQLILVHTQPIDGLFIQEFNADVLPFQRLRGTCRVAQFPRNTMGKVQRSELAQTVGKSYQLI